MMQLDQKVFFTALGFLAVVLNDEPKDKQAQRATALAELIEEFSTASTSEIGGTKSTQQLLDGYITELKDNGSASLDYDRTTLIDMYKMLLAQKVWHEQRGFFATGHEDLIANHIVQLAEERLQWGEQS